MRTIELGNVVLECVQGDITQQPDVDAIVNAANAQLMPGGGVAGAIHRAAGPELAAECRALAPIEPGEAVITGAHRLPNRFVIHCLGPVYGVNEPSEVLLASCYRKALRLAEEHRVSSIAFPAISTGVFGYPTEPAARIALDTVISQLGTIDSIRRIRFVLFGRADLAVYESAFAELAQHRKGPATAPPDRVRGGEGLHMRSVIRIEALGGSRYRVTVQEGGGQTVHDVTATAADVDRYVPGVAPERLIRASFEFLLEREPKEAILPAFDLPAIERYFREYPSRIRDALGG